MIRCTLILLLFIGSYLFLQHKSQGFRYSHVLSSEGKSEGIVAGSCEKLLDQRFTYLKKGSTSYVFVGEDKKTILKLFNHTMSLQNVFASATRAYLQIKDETGLLYLHLGETQNLNKRVTIYDPLGIPYQLDLDKVDFLLQKRATSICRAIKESMEQDEVENAKRIIAQLLETMELCYSKGLVDTDDAVKRNYGVASGKVIALDVGAFRPVDQVENSTYQTALLQLWLEKHYPELASCLQMRKELQKQDPSKNLSQY